MQSSYKSFFIELVKIIIISAVIIIPVRIFFIHPFIVKGISMEQSFSNNDYLIVNRFTYRFNEPRRGDVVVFKSPLNLKDYLIKRVIGLPGEEVEIKNGRIFIKNNSTSEFVQLDESSYLSDSVQTYPEGNFILEQGYYFVLGDNRSASMDSRLFGPLHEGLIIGRAWVRGWPFSRAEAFTGVMYPAGL